MSRLDNYQKLGHHEHRDYREHDEHLLSEGHTDKMLRNHTEKACIVDTHTGCISLHRK